MSGHKRDHEEEEARPRVRVTDKRRVRADAGSGEPSEARGPSEVASTTTDAERQLKEYKEHLQRLTAEFDNYRKRVLKEQTRAVEMASEPLMRRLLEVLDEFELALMAAEQRPDFDRFLHGVELVYAKLIDSLRAEGLAKIEALALRHAFDDIEQHDVAEFLGRGPVGAGRADIAGADDGDFRSAH